MLDITKRKCLAIAWTVLLLRPYLEASRFAIHIDHDPLKWNLIKTDTSGRLALWKLRLSELNLNVVYDAGTQH